MKTKLLTLFFVLTAGVSVALAWDYEQIQIGDLFYNLDALNHTAEVTCQYEKNPKNYSGLISANIPASIVYDNVSYSVTSIGSCAFLGCKNISSVTIPNSVTSIGSTSFMLCGISTINFIGNINEWCNKPWSPTSISANYELYIDGVIQKNIIIPNRVTNIGEGAFQGCCSLATIKLPNSVASIGRSAFSSCVGLTSIVIPNGITCIEFQTFSQCGSLASVTIPESVTQIEMFAFSGCIGLTSIICKATTPPACTSITFNDVPKSIQVYVPSASMNAYKGADVWKEFTDYKALNINK